MNPSLLRFDQFAASTLISVAWQAVLLTGAAAALLRLFPRLSAAARFTAWATVFVLLLLLPFLPTTHTAAALTPYTVTPFWTEAAAFLWLSLSLWRALVLLREFLHLRSIARRAHPLPPSAAPSAHHQLPARICLSPDVRRPSVIGFFHPRILIPVDLYARLSSAELDHILLHERQHLRRRDVWLNLLQKVGLVLFPLNPALLWVERRLCFERELACDEGVLAATNAPVSYARSLVSLAEHTLLGRQLSLALGAWEHRSELSRRVHRILAARTPALTSRYTTVALALFAVSLAASAAALARAPQLIAFTGPSPARLAYAATPLPTAPASLNPARNTHTASSLPVSPYAASSTMTSSLAPAHPILVPAMFHSASHPASKRAESHRAAGLPPHPAPLRRILTSYVLPDRSPILSPGSQIFTWRERTISSPNPADVLRSTVSGVRDTMTYNSPNPAPTILFTVFNSPTGSPSYAAIPTPGGWLVFQL